MVDAFQDAALATRLGIPLLYGVDSVHGHGNLVGATVFPHNIGLGATRDPGLVERIEHVTATETRATGPQWSSPPVSVWPATCAGAAPTTRCSPTATGCAPGRADRR
jgi:beta-glucosidase-like glycosyl hydrolase